MSAKKCPFQHLDYIGYDEYSQQECIICKNLLGEHYECDYPNSKKYETECVYWLLKKESLDLQQKVEQLENIRKEAIEYIHEHQLVFELSSKKQIQYWFDEFYRDLLNILNKGE